MNTQPPENWLSNADTPFNAIITAKRMNDLAKSGNIVMDCSFYEYYVDEPFVDFDSELELIEEMKKMGGIYRRKLEKCACCGQSISQHQNANVSTLPCGGKII